VPIRVWSWFREVGSGRACGWVARRIGLRSPCLSSYVATVWGESLPLEHPSREASGPAVAAWRAFEGSGGLGVLRGIGGDTLEFRVGCSPSGSAGTLEVRGEGVDMSPRVDDSSVGGERSSVPSLREPRYSQSIERGLAILEFFTSERPMLGISDIADPLGMGRSTTHRYVVTLVALGFLERGANHRYRLGLRVTDLGMSALCSMGLREHSRSALEELRQRSGYTASLAVLDGPEILYVDRARSFRRGQYKIDLNVRVGSRLLAHCTALGKVLLAFMSEADRRGVIAQMELAKRGPHTITSKKALLAELERVCDEGFAVGDEELAAGLISIAVPVRSESREVIAAVNMAAHTDMISLEELVGKLLPHLLSTADQISARLGYRRDDEVTR
jgi:IclR family pca regulon transcriptional regulator